MLETVLTVIIIIILIGVALAILRVLADLIGEAVSCGCSILVVIILILVGLYFLDLLPVAF